jgi:hypothetical protein
MNVAPGLRRLAAPAPPAASRPASSEAMVRRSANAVRVNVRAGAPPPWRL